MTNTLKIEPKYRKKTSLSDELKFVLRKKYNGIIHNHNISESDLSYFEALRDAGIKDAEIILSMINKYDECVLNEES